MRQIFNDLTKVKNVFVISDVHGCAKTLESLLRKLPKKSLVYVTGDLIDRGPDSKKVLQILLDNILDLDLTIQCLKGNHEEMFIKWTRTAFNPFCSHSYLSYGGQEHIDSYEFPKDVHLYQRYISMLDNLPSVIITNIERDNKKLVLSHSKILGYINKLDKLYQKDLESNKIQKRIEEHESYSRWCRDFNEPRHVLNEAKEYINVFGHTVVSDFKQKFLVDGVIKKTGFVCIDGGCVYNDKQSSHLIAYDFLNDKVIKVENIDV